jgi:hypothetical protein
MSEVDDIQYEMTKMKNKLKELTAIHANHLNRPTLDDNLEEERSIDMLTQEITQVIGFSHKFGLRTCEMVNLQWSSFNGFLTF